MTTHQIVVENKVIEYLADSYYEERNDPNEDPNLELKCIVMTYSSLNVPKVLDHQTRGKIYDHFAKQLYQTIIER